MEREKHAVARDMDVRLKITKAKTQRALKRDEGVLWTRQMVTPMRESKYPIVLKKRMQGHALAFLL